MKKIFSLFIALCFAASLHAQTTSFNITYQGFTTEAQTAFQYASDFWAHTVVSSVPIKVTVHFAPLPGGLLGITFPNGRKNFAGAPMADKWYATSLANAITGKELNPGEADVEMFISSAWNWYYGTTGAVPPGQYDFVSVAMHELCHGLGFISVAKDSSGIGSFGTVRNEDFGGIVSAFPWPDLQSFPTVFDNFLVTTTDQHLDSFPNPSVILSQKFLGNQVYFNGANAMAANGGKKPRIYAPSTFALGSSITHLDEATYPEGDPNEMMTPNGNLGKANHSPGPICLGILNDIGWTINTSSSVSEIHKNDFGIYPNPASKEINIMLASADNIKTEILNIFGVVVIKDQNSKRIDVSQLDNGIYFLRVTVGNINTIRKIIIQK